MYIINSRVRRINLKTIEELKKYLLQEWNAIPQEMVKNLCKNYLERIKKVLEMDGARIEPEYIKKSDRNEYEWIIPQELPNERIIYNDQKLRFYKAKEVKLLKKTLKEKKSLQTKKMKAIAKKIRAFRKRDLKNLSIGKALSILKDREELIEKKKNSKKEKEAIDEEFTKKIEKISKMKMNTLDILMGMMKSILMTRILIPLLMMFKKIRLMI